MAQYRRQQPQACCRTSSSSPPKKASRMSRKYVEIAFLLVAIFCRNNVVNASYSMVVPSGEEECFVIRAPQKEKSLISGNYDILDDDLAADPIAVTLYNSNRNDVWHSRPGASEGTFTVSGSGVHELCISNGLGGSGGRGRNTMQRSDGTERTVGFAIRVKPLQRGAVGDSKEGPEDERTSNLMAMSSTLMEGLATMMDHQGYLKDREAKHQELTSQTYGRVMRWTFLEAFVLCTIAGGQVLYLRKFFEQRRYL